jgi:hypothetical protein
MHSTPQIADEFSADWSVTLPVLPHPSTTFGDAAVHHLDDMPKPRPGKPLRVVFPGGTRKEKGFALATGACELLAGSADLTLGLRARIDHASGKDLERALQHLIAEVGTKVEILDDDLSDDEFIDMIRTADIVVIPYLSDAFRRRTSGILVDAFLLGKPVVVLKNTWLSDIVEAGHIGLCADPDPVSLATAVRGVAQRYAEFLPGIARVRRDYRGTHSWTALIKSVVEVAGLGLAAPQSIAPADLRGPAPVQAISLAAQLLCAPADALRLIEADRSVNDLVARTLDGSFPDRRLSRHLEKCIAFARKKTRA